MRVALDLLAGALGQADARERRVDPRGRLGAADGSDDAQVLASGEVQVKARLLDDRADALQRLRALGGHGMAEQAHAAGARLGEAEQHADHRRLAGAVRAEEAERRAARHLQVDAVERRALAEALGQAAGLDRRSAVDRC